MRLLTVLAFSLFFLPMTGCKVGPDYTPPFVYLPAQFNEDQKEQTEEIEDECLNHWWQTFDDPFLDYLIELTLEQNLDYKIALERVMQARSLYWINFTQILPEIEIDSFASRSGVSQSFKNSTLNQTPQISFFQAEFDLLWEIDLFGKLRRSADASYNLWEATADELRGIKISIISEVATTYAAICSYQQLQSLLIDTIAIDEDFLSFIQEKLAAGLSDDREVGTFTATLEEDKATLEATLGALDQSIYSLSVLLGLIPEEVHALFSEKHEIPYAQRKIPIGLPSDLLRRRPDIQSAERQLAAATEQIGVAVADLFPSISLTGSSSSFAANPLQGSNLGFASNRLNKLFQPQSFMWGFGSFIVFPVFDFGQRASAIDVQVTLRNQAYYSYQQTVIQALQETEQFLGIYFHEEKRSESLTLERKAYENVLSLVSDLFEAGLSDYLEVLVIKKSWTASLISETNSQRALVSDLIAIYKALGGDWE